MDKGFLLLALPNLLHLTGACLREHSTQADSGSQVSDQDMPLQGVLGTADSALTQAGSHLTVDGGVEEVVALPQLGGGDGDRVAGVGEAVDAGAAPTVLSLRGRARSGW